MNTTTEKATKPLGHRAYGSIPHLPGSRRGQGDHGISEQQARICTTKVRDKRDNVIVQEKLDGTCVSVARIGDDIVPLIRAGYAAKDSHFMQHLMFHEWAMQNSLRFFGMLRRGERIVGEWLAQAHGTRYRLFHEPFVAFDIMVEHERLNFGMCEARATMFAFSTPRIIHCGGSISIQDVMVNLEPSGHGALDPVEGAVWRVERDGKVDFLAKYVRSDKVDGKYLESVTGGEPVWNWTP